MASSFTQADLDNLDLAIKGGVLRADVAGRSVIYRSLDEMRKIRGQIANSLNASAGKPVRRRALQGVSQTGF